MEVVASAAAGTRVGQGCSAGTTRTCAALRLRPGRPWANGGLLLEVGAEQRHARSAPTGAPGGPTRASSPPPKHQDYTTGIARMQRNDHNTRLPLRKRGLLSLSLPFSSSFTYSMTEES